MAVKIGELVKFHRKKAGITQKVLAELAGVGKTTVFDIEKNKQTIQLENVLRILNVLNITLTAVSPFGETLEVENSHAARYCTGKRNPCRISG